MPAKRARRAAFAASARAGIVVAVSAAVAALAAIHNELTGEEYKNVDFPNLSVDEYGMSNVTVARAMFRPLTRGDRFTACKLGGVTAAEPRAPAAPKLALLVPWAEARAAGCRAYKHLMRSNCWSSPAPGDGRRGKGSGCSGEGAANGAAMPVIQVPDVAIISNSPLSESCCKDPFFLAPSAFFASFHSSRVIMTGVDDVTMEALLDAMDASGDGQNGTLTLTVTSRTDGSTAQLRSKPFLAFAVAKSALFALVLVYSVASLVKAILADGRLAFHVRNGMIVGSILWALGSLGESVVYTHVFLTRMFPSTRTHETVAMACSWFGFVAGYAAYSMMLLRWVKISRGIFMGTKLIEYMRNYYEVFCVASVVYVFINATVLVVALQVENMAFRFAIIVTASNVLGITLLVQSAGMIYYGAWLLRAFRRAKYSEVLYGQHVLAKKITILGLTGVVGFVVIAFSVTGLAYNAFFSPTAFFLHLLVRPGTTLLMLSLTLYTLRLHGASVAAADSPNSTLVDGGTTDNSSAVDSPGMTVSRPPV